MLDLKHNKPLSVFPSSPREFGKYTIAETDPGTRPVDRSPYRANPRVQETVDMCVNKIEHGPSRLSGSAVTVVAKSDATPR